MTSGSVEDIPEILSVFDIAVLSSLSEGFSNSILEYMAMSLPAVVSDVGGNGEAVGKAGFVVPAGDANALAICLEELAQDGARRAEFKVKARSRAEDFGLDNVGAEIARYYGRLIHLP
jgi:glycosyltransferase involved in cell wall biosynthesis